MGQSRMKFCSEGGCVGIAVSGNFCPEHLDPLQRKERNTPRHEMDAWYRRACWKGKNGVRALKIRRNPLCETPGCGNKACDVHHTRPWKDTRDWFIFMGGIDMQFLQSLCKRCHSAITMKEFQFGPDQKQER
jgi:hypothetical protein